jgi:hypothetical protein
MIEETVRYQQWMHKFMWMGEENPFQEDTFFEIHLVVACTDANGSPTLEPVVIVQTAEQISHYSHYDAAIALLQTNSFEGPFIAFDEADNPKLMTLFNWDEGLR